MNSESQVLRCTRASTPPRSWPRSRRSQLGSSGRKVAVRTSGHPTQAAKRNEDWAPGEAPRAQSPCLSSQTDAKGSKKEYPMPLRASL